MMSKDVLIVHIYVVTPIGGEEYMYGKIESIVEGKEKSYKIIIGMNRM